MGKKNQRELLDEYLISWKSGSSPKRIEKDLIRRGRLSRDVKKARKIFERWASSSKKKDWSKLIKSV